AWRASTPLARTRMTSPGAAASIISPMMDAPLTSTPSLVTLMLAWNWFAVPTNLAEARACRPRLLRIIRLFSITGGPGWGKSGIPSGPGGAHGAPIGGVVPGAGQDMGGN